MKIQRFIPAVIAVNMLLIGCDKDNDNDTPYTPQATVVNAAGDVSAALAQFRSILGDSLNTAPGKTSGRREVNWDGVALTFTNNNNFPSDFFNNTDPAGPNGRKRGIVYEITGAGFRVDSSAFADIEPSYANTFKAFSPKKLIAPVGTNITEITFRVPGTNTNAFVKGFGVIFSDVDNTNYTTVEYFNGSKSLGTFKAPARNDANGFSFLGVFFPDEKVTRIKITAGNGILDTDVKDISEGGSKDLVVMDDFFYNEPLAVE